MKKFIKMPTEVLSALALVVGMIAVTPNEVLSSKKISRKKAGKIFFYCNSKDKIRGEIIEWKKE